MKALYCPYCHDVFGLSSEHWKRCSCKKSGGQYNEDHVTATVGGAAKVLGIPNPFLKEDPKDCKRQEIWFGEFPGDNQLFRRKSAKSKRLTHKQVMKKFVETGPNLMTGEPLTKLQLQQYYEYYNFGRVTSTTLKDNK